MDKVVRVAIDAMGGDYAPGEIVKGAVLATKGGEIEAILVGRLPLIEAELAKYDTTKLAIRCVKADEFIQETEHPALALRRKPDASIAVATRLVKEGEADAMVSAGSTGAVVAATFMVLGTLEGIERPVVGGTFVGFAPKTIVMDLGGSVDCKPSHLLNFAVIGSVYARKLLDVANPTVALLSIGTEEGKGNDLVRQSYTLLHKSGLNFTGNVEGSDIVTGRANVVLCDGFVGNILVKFYEGMGKTIAEWLKNILAGHLAPKDAEDITAQLISLTNIADTTGGGPLLGVNGVVIKAHGRSRAQEIAKAVSMAKQVVDSDLVETLKSELSQIRQNLNLP